MRMAPCVFELFFSASYLFTLLHSGAIPPLVVKTRGLNEDYLVEVFQEYYLWNATIKRRK